MAVAMLVILIIAICLRLATAPIPLERDEGVYAYIGWHWLQGAVPYLDSFSQKTPGSFAVYATVLRLFGSSPTALHWGIQLYHLPTLALVFWLGLRLFGRVEAFVATLLACLLMADPNLYGNAANTETLAMLPLTAATIAALRASESGGWRRCALTGALGAIALLFKPQVAPIVIFHFLAIATTRSRWLASAWSFALGCAAVLGLAGLYFWVEGALWPMWDATVRFNLRYAAGVHLASYPTMLAKQMGPTLPGLWPIYAAVLLGLVTPELRDRSAPAPEARTPRGSRRSWLWVAAWLAASLVAAASGGWFRRHYFHLAIPPASLMAAVGLRALGRALLAGRPARLLSAGLALAIVAFCVHGSWWYYGPGSPMAKSRRLYGANPFAESPAVGEFLASHSEPRDRIFVYGSEPQLLFYAQRESASRYICVYALNLPFDEARSRQLEVLEELAERPPRLIVATFHQASHLESASTPQDLRDGLRELLDSAYQLLAVVPYRSDDETKIVTGDAARRIWTRAPLWDREYRPWAAFVVWERKAVAALPGDEDSAPRMRAMREPSREAMRLARRPLGSSIPGCEIESQAVVAGRDFVTAFIEFGFDVGILEARVVGDGHLLAGNREGRVPAEGHHSLTRGDVLHVEAVGKAVAVFVSKRRRGHGCRRRRRYGKPRSFPTPRRFRTRRSTGSPGSQARPDRMEDRRSRRPRAAPPATRWEAESRERRIHRPCARTSSCPPGSAPRRSAPTGSRRGSPDGRRTRNMGSGRTAGRRCGCRRSGTERNGASKPPRSSSPGPVRPPAASSNPGESGFLRGSADTPGVG